MLLTRVNHQNDEWLNMEVKTLVIFHQFYMWPQTKMYTTLTLCSQKDVTEPVTGSEMNRTRWQYNYIKNQKILLLIDSWTEKWEIIKHSYHFGNWHTHEYFTIDEDCSRIFMSHELKNFEWISGTLDKVFVPQSADPFQVDMCFSLPVLKTVKLTIYTIISFFLWNARTLKRVGNNSVRGFQSTF